MEGVVNNGLGVIGFVQTASKADDAFNARMEREAALAAKVCMSVCVSILITINQNHYRDVRCALHLCMSA